MNALLYEATVIIGQFTLFFENHFTAVIVNASALIRSAALLWVGSQVCSVLTGWKPREGCVPLSVVEDWILGIAGTYGTQREYILNWTFRKEPVEPFRQQMTQRMERNDGSTHVKEDDLIQHDISLWRTYTQLTNYRMKEMCKHLLEQKLDSNASIVDFCSKICLYNDG